jgi:GDP-mannose 6-dehydrogenase
MRSTVLPGTARNVVIPTIEKYSGKKVGVDFGYVSNPEFLRESTAIWDFYNPPKTVIGYSDEKTKETFIKLYDFLNAPLFTTEIEVAEMVKYADNSWHAVKVTFANEIGMIAKKIGIDSHKVMNIFCADTKLNISTYYLKPGFAFGGSCLPKDVKALTYKAKSLDEDTKLLNSLMPSNEYQIDRIIKDFIRPLRKKRIAILGITFKAGTNDLRESPVLELTERLIGKGYIVDIYDPNVLKAKESGADKALLENELWHINERLSNDINKTVENSDIVIIGNKNDEFIKAVQKSYDKKIIDLVRLFDRKSNDKYKGIAW